MSGHTVIILILMFAAGLALGAFYFLGLWQTLKRLPRTQHRAGLILISFAVRLAVVLAVLFFLMDGRWERAAAAMIGFVLMRKILTYRLGPQSMAEAQLKQETTV